jgi:hypothetical protein
MVVSEGSNLLMVLRLEDLFGLQELEYPIEYR